MAQSLIGIDALKQYLSRVVVRASHHAPNVTEVIGHLAVAVIWSHDAGSLEYREFAGNPTNILRFTYRSTRYSLLYNHQGGRIEAREGSDTGRPCEFFSNGDTLADVLLKFSRL
jgi:Integron cassette protein VCH_CASS1 chain